MGFLKELAQSIAEKEEAERALIVQALKQRQIQRQQDLLRREPNEERKQCALLYRQESGIGVLVKKFGEILASEMITFHYTLWGERFRSSGMKSLIRTEVYNDPYSAETKVPRGVSKGPDYEVTAYGNNDAKYPLKYPEINPNNVNSVLDIAVWDTTYIGRGRTNSHNGIYSEYSEYRIKYLSAESSPDGYVIFLGNIDPISQEDWRTQPDLLERRLKSAYLNPQIHTFNAGFSKFKGYVTPEPRYRSPNNHGPWS